MDNKIQEIKKLINNNPWFARYYDINDFLIVGLRDNKEREKIYSLYDFSDKNILDVGCNIGKNFMFFKDKKAKKMVGVDTKESIEIINIFKDYYKIENIEGISLDLNDPKWFSIVEKKSGISTWDYSLYVSVYGTKELHNRDIILKDLIKNTKNVMFFEGHNLESKDYYSKILLKNDAKNFEFKGYFRDKEEDKTSQIRPFFTIINNNFSKEYIIQKINEIQKTKGRVVVGIEGKAGVGKTTFFNELYEIYKKENELKIEFIDDLKGLEGNYSPTNTLYKNIRYRLIKIIKNLFGMKSITKSLNQPIYNRAYDLVLISDYKVKEYVNELDILISIDINEEERQKRLEKRDNGIKKYNNKTIKSKKISVDNFYTISL